MAISNSSKRQEKILEILSIRRFDTIANLADEFGVSRYTIMRDIRILIEYSPIYTVRGPAGGVYFEKDCFHTKSEYASSKYLSDKQEKTIRDIIEGLPPNISELHSILIDFAKPK